MEQTIVILWSDSHSKRAGICSYKVTPDMLEYALIKAWSPYGCSDRNFRHKYVSNSVPSNFDTRKHFDYNIASLTSIVINYSVSSTCHHPRHVSSLVSSGTANLNQRDMAKLKKNSN